MTKSQEENKRLCKLYPFLQIRNVWTDETFEDEDYSFTQLDNLLPGWKGSFGEQMCAELKEALGDEIGEWRILQLKEKYGEMRLYSNWVNEKVGKVIRKYEDISRRTCGECGARAEWTTKGWIYPLCEECARRISRRKFPDNFERIE